MSRFKIIGQMERTPTNREMAIGQTFCKSCGRPLAGSGRYHEQCDRCFREQLRDTNRIEAKK